MAYRITTQTFLEIVIPNVNHSVRQPAPAPAQQYFPLTPLQPPAPAAASQQYFSLTPLQSPAPAPAQRTE